ncbi:MAG: DUF1800 domain-containing protein, partial [Acidimicrobiales bacterium]
CSSLAKVSNRQWMFDQNQLFRTHGLGNFEDLVQRVSVQPAMLRYLDNDRNVAGSPNENFAREVMELFTLGVGNYSEDDVTESARAWTGHTLTEDGAYVFDSGDHDFGNKTFFGDTRDWDGPGVLNHIINGPKKSIVARYIATKMWSFFAYPNPEPAVIDTVAAAFESGGMEIKPLIRAILLHPQFRSTKAKNGLIRSPIEFVVAAMRQSGFGCDVARPEWTLHSMGQEPYVPPNVSGWKQNGYWVNSSGLWAKSKFASRIRWRLYHLDELDGSSSTTPAQAADAALARFGIVAPTASTRNSLIAYVENERANTSWGERAGLLYLPLLTPEFQLA